MMIIQFSNRSELLDFLIKNAIRQSARFSKPALFLKIEKWLHALHYLAFLEHFGRNEEALKI